MPRSICAAASLVLVAGCGGSDGEVTDDDAVADEPTAVTSAQESAAGSGDEGSTDDPQDEGEASGDDPSDGSGSEQASGAQEERLQVLLADAQMLCDALDEEELTGVLTDFSELRPDEVTDLDSLCSMRDDRFEVGRVWVQGDWSEREFLQSMAAEPYEPCEVAGYAAVCQTHDGDPELANGWPRVAVQIGTMGVETQAPTAAAAQELAAAVLDDVLAE